MWKIAPRLYLGDYRSGEEALAGNKQVVEPEGKLAPFAGVVSLCPMPLAPDRPDGPAHQDTEWLQIPIADGGAGEAELAQALSVVQPFVSRRMRHGNVLVHCTAGMSRSVSVVAALLCSSSGLDVDAALDRIASAKATALGRPRSPGWTVISPAGEFLTGLRRMFAKTRHTPDPPGSL